MPPFPGIPYGPAPAWCFAITEGSLYLLLLACFIHAVRCGRRSVAYLTGGLAFGLLLEYIEVATGSYTYGHFWFMIGRTPLAIPFCIGVGWAVILYTSRLFSDALRLPLIAAAACDTLLALNIDLSMDVVAYRLHLWHWYWNGTGLNPLTAQWFGIPYGNFIGWITVVFCYSAFSRLFESKMLVSGHETLLRCTAVTLLALICSQAVLFGSESFVYPFLRGHFGVSSAQRLVCFSLVLIAFVLYGLRGVRRPIGRIPPIAMWAPCWFHVFFVFCFFTFRFYREGLAITIAACVNVAAGFLVHLYPWREGAKFPEREPDSLYESASAVQQ